MTRRFFLFPRFKEISSVEVSPIAELAVGAHE